MTQIINLWDTPKDSCKYSGCTDGDHLFSQMPKLYIHLRTAHKFEALVDGTKSKRPCRREFFQMFLKKIPSEIISDKKIKNLKLKLRFDGVVDPTFLHQELDSPELQSLNSTPSPSPHQRLLARARQERLQACRSSTTSGCEKAEQQLAQVRSEHQKEKNEFILQQEDDKKKIEDLQFRLEEESIARSDLEGQIEENQAAITKLKEDLQARRKGEQHVVAVQGSAAKEKDDLIFQLQTTLETKKSELGNVQQRLKVTQEELNRSEERHKKQLDVIDDLNLKLSRYETSSSELTEELQNWKSSFSDLQRQQQATEDRCESLNKAKATLEQQLTQTAAGKLELEHQLTKTTDESEQQLAQTVDSKTKLEQELTQSRDDKSKLEQTVKELADYKLSSEQLLAETLDAKTKLEQQLMQSVSSEERDLESQVVALKAEVKRLQDEHSTHRENIMQQIKEAGEQNRAMEDLDYQLKHYEETLEKLQVQLFQSEEDCERLRDNLTSSDKSKDEFFKENALLRNRLEAASTKGTDTSNNLQKLEEEKNQLGNKVVELQVLLQQARTSMNGADPTWKSFQEEKEAFHGQVEFLNSVIVDMQKKNDDLSNKIRVLEEGDMLDLNLNGIKTAIAPRLFCDICDQFDLHDTEDCPTQASAEPEVTHSRHSGKRKDDRPYCDSCEVFGHWTKECDDNETF